MPDCIRKIEGVVNVPAETVRPLHAIRLHAARPAGTNQPTAEGVTGASQIIDLFASARPDDMGISLLSGGGSALLPAPDRPFYLVLRLFWPKESALTGQWRPPAVVRVEK